MYRLLYSLVVLFASLYSTFAAPVPLEAKKLAVAKSSHEGRGTWFNVGLGNCGLEDTDADPIVAISKTLYDQNSGDNCNQWISIDYSGKSVYAKVRDSCQSCGYYDIDMSPATFKGLASLATGQIEVSWSFMDKSWKP